MNDVSPIDPFALLEGHGATALLEAPSADTPEAQALLAQIMAEPVAAPPPERPGRWRLAAAVAAGIVAVAATWILVTGDVAEPVGITCFAETRLDANRLVINVDSADDYLPTACSLPWAGGELSNPSLPSGEVPPLQGCVSDAGTLFVFPTADPAACGRLGLAVAEPVLDDASVPVVELQSRLSDFIAAAGCAQAEETASFAAATLADLGLTSWTVDTSRPQPPELPCVSVTFDMDAMVVTITPIPAEE